MNYELTNTDWELICIRMFRKPFLFLCLAIFNIIHIHQVGQWHILHNDNFFCFVAYSIYLTFLQFSKTNTKRLANNNQ